jgi:hypothetical protein
MANIKEPLSILWWPPIYPLPLCEFVHTQILIHNLVGQESLAEGKAVDLVTNADAPLVASIGQ